MEHFNKIELCGEVGRIKREMVGDEQVARISLGVDYKCTTCVGSQVRSRDWFDLVAWKGPKVNFDLVTPGDTLFVIGRVRVRSYMGANGRALRSVEVVVTELKWEGK